MSKYHFSFRANLFMALYHGIIGAFLMYDYHTYDTMISGLINPLAFASCGYYLTCAYNQARLTVEPVKPKAESFFEGIH